MSARTYLVSTDDEADFTLHAATIRPPTKPLVAIMNPDGEYACPECGRRHRRTGP